jgi:hypothetical protein
MTTDKEQRIANVVEDVGGEELLQEIKRRDVTRHLGNRKPNNAFLCTNADMQEARVRSRNR